MLAALLDKEKATTCASQHPGSLSIIVFKKARPVDSLPDMTAIAAIPQAP
jgi:hypothetical protein